MVEAEHIRSKTYGLVVSSIPTQGLDCAVKTLHFWVLLYLGAHPLCADGLHHACGKWISQHQLIIFTQFPIIYPPWYSAANYISYSLGVMSTL